MRLTRENEHRSKLSPHNHFIMIRSNGTVVAASEWYYSFIGDMSKLPIFDLILEEDAEKLRAEMDKISAARERGESLEGFFPLEFLTTLSNLQGEIIENVYLSVNDSTLTENGAPLLKIIFLDLKNEFAVCSVREELISKYRYFLTMKNEMYFEFNLKNENFVLYKYIGEKSIKIADTSLDQFVEMQRQRMQQSGNTDASLEESLDRFCKTLREGNQSFDVSFRKPQEDEDRRKNYFRIKGGICSAIKDMVIGVVTISDNTTEEAYYLSAAGKDPGTGLLNKKAATEYAVERLHDAGDKIVWMVIIDIDDFKHINDSFGHMFGDEVIQFVANSFQTEVGQRGVVGRFGGDEFFLLIDKIPERDVLRTMFKKVVKDIALAFDPKLTVTLSIGVSCYPTNGTSFEELFSLADKALYIAKAKGKNRHIIYDEQLHGSYQINHLHEQSLAYAISTEKRRKLLVNLLTALTTEGASVLARNQQMQKDLRMLYDLDGISIYTDYGRQIICREGNYIASHYMMEEPLADEKYLALFDANDMFVLNSVDSLRVLHPKSYEGTMAQEVGASIQCLARKEGKPYAIVFFDVLNKKRKWCDQDIEMLGMIGSVLAKSLCQ